MGRRVATRESMFPEFEVPSTANCKFVVFGKVACAAQVYDEDMRFDYNGLF